MEGIRWDAVTCSIVGDSHLKNNLPNQDAIGFCELPGNSPAYVMAVSDGHGSEKCPRSDKGAEFAVNTAVKVFTDFWSVMKSRLEELEIDDHRSAMLKIERHIRKVIPEKLIEQWVSAVESHSTSVPLPSDEGQTKRLLAYGATLTIVFLCEHFSACLRLGDCEVLIVTGDLKISRIVPRDRAQVGEDTDSLCMPDAVGRFSVSFDGFDSAFYHTVRLFLVCSDGYEKAFESNAGFEQSAIDFAGLIRSNEGRETISRELESWLREYSHHSGDDVSVGLLFAKPNSTESAVANEADDRLETSDRSAATVAALSEDNLDKHSEITECDPNESPKMNDK